MTTPLVTATSRTMYTSFILSYTALSFRLLSEDGIRVCLTYTPIPEPWGKGDNYVIAPSHE